MTTDGCDGEGSEVLSGEGETEALADSTEATCYEYRPRLDYPNFREIAERCEEWEPTHEAPESPQEPR